MARTSIKAANEKIKKGAAKGATITIGTRETANEVHSESMKVEQRSVIGDYADGATGVRAVEGNRGEIVKAEQVMDKDYLEELKFMEEPVTVRIEPRSEKNSPTHFPMWCNGKGCEIFVNGRWIEAPYVTVGVPVIMKRKYLEILARAKVDTKETDILNPTSEHPNNIIKTFTSPVHSFSVIKDANPRGMEWLTELHRRYA